MTRPVPLVVVFGLLLAGCPIAPDNYGDDAGADAGSVADAGSTATVDAGCPTGSLTTSGSAEDDLDDMAAVVGDWSGSTGDLCDSVLTSDGTTYDVNLYASNATSGTLELAFELGVGTTGPLATDLLVQESYSPPSTLGIQDSWTCGAGGACGPYVTVTSFDGQTLIGTYSVQFYEGSSESQTSTCNLSGNFNIEFP